MTLFRSLITWFLYVILQKLCQAVLTVLNQPVQPQCQSTCLETLRILSRDKRVLGPVATRNGILTLARLACIRLPGCDSEPSKEWKFDSAEEERVMVEALKCFCNVVYNSEAAQQVVADVRLGQGLCARLSSLGSAQHEVGLFSLRLLFLLSALRADIRRRLRQEMNAVELLTGVLERTLDVRWSGKYEVSPPVAQAPHVSSEKLDQTIDALKALFNITMADSNDEVRTIHLRRDLNQYA